MYGIQKDGNDDPVCETAKETVLNNRLLDSVGEGEGEMIRENSIETCISAYVKQMTSPSLIHETGHSKPAHWDKPEGWDGEGGGRGSGTRGTWTPVADPCQCVTETTTIL